jgi:hypothetical protein
MAYRDVVLADNPTFYYRMEETSGDILTPMVHQPGHEPTATTHAQR